MRFQFHNNFKKEYQKLKEPVKQKFSLRLKIFADDLYHPTLNNHGLAGRYKGYRSINITGDIRAIYKFKSNDTVIFVNIGNHSKLYK
jgi:addiction module RelE/StbE family toxin